MVLAERSWHRLSPGARVRRTGGLARPLVSLMKSALIRGDNSAVVTTRSLVVKSFLGTSGFAVGGRLGTW